ncbi:MAG: FliM/FliN family flagellar motor switch protein [Sandaracinus sp.]|jgi:flagellar motor switch protein FliM|nr:FliM/FliN family flagellar motor switch protein [Sandaracinus sp.]MCB9632460.1 FliM/FliN family flagellar motor switch protein [Sandaracinus sp.]
MTDGGFEPLLSAEETSALLEAMQASEGSKEAVSLDLASPEARLRRHLVTADHAADAWRESLVRTFLRHTGLLPSLDVASVEVVPAELFFGRLEPGTCLLRSAVRGGGTVAVLVDASLTSFALDRRLGASLATTQDPERTAPRLLLSAVERRVLRPFFDDAVALPALATDGEPVLEVGGTTASLRAEPLLVVDLRVDLGLGAAPLVYAFDLAATRRAFPEEALPPAKSGSRNERRAMSTRLRETEVELAAVLGEVVTHVGALLELKKGSVLRLDTPATSSVELRVEGVPTLLGRPCVEHGNLAVRVTGALPVRPDSNRR